MQGVQAGAVVTTDGVIRNPQATSRALESDTWDGRRGSYIPVAPLSIDPSLELHTEADLDIDPITYQVLRSRFWHKNLEHGDVIQRVSGSAPVVYSRDYATAICTEEGDVVVVSPTIQFFSALADLIVKWTLEHRSTAPGIRDGDVFLQNDPYIGAAQQSDTSFYAPVFWDGKLFCWVFNTLHVGDIGGVDAGGWAVNARDFFDESVTMPPVRLVEQGTIRWDIAEAFTRSSREPDSILLNIKSALAGLRAIREQMLEMLEAFGPAVVKGVMRKTIADTSKVVSERLHADPRRHVERAPLRDGAHARRGHDAPGGADAHEARRPGRLQQRRDLAAGRRGQLDVRLPARRGRRRDRHGAGVGPARVRGGRREPRRVRPRARHPQRRPLARGRVRAPEHVHHARPRGRRDEQDAPRRTGGPARARVHGRRPVAPAGRHRPGLRRAHAPGGDPGQRGPGAARRLPRGLPVPRRHRQRRLLVDGRLVGRQRRGGRGGRHRARALPLREPRQRRAGAVAGRQQPRLRLDAAQGRDGDVGDDLGRPEREPGAVARRRAARARRQLPASRQRRGRQGPRGRRAAGQPRGGRGAGRPALAPAPEGPAAAAEGRLRGRGVQRLRRLRRPARARPRARRAGRRRRQGRPRVGRAPLRRGPRRRRRRRRRHRGAAGGDPRGAARRRGRVRRRRAPRHDRSRRGPRARRSGRRRRRRARRRAGLGLLGLR